MFSYYGSKSKVIDLYPAPKYDKIIEPFAGSARYALKYFDHDVLLVDKYEVIVKIWHYLQQASPADIMGLPEIERGQSVDELNISQAEKWLIGFCLNIGSSQPKKTAQLFSSWNYGTRKQIADQLFKIKHWTIKHDSFDSIENQYATWFIDPPYQVGGEWYVKSEVNFSILSAWCKSRQGQVIVCENTKANWLPFTPIGGMNGAYSKTTEAMWCNDFAQLPMFAPSAPTP